MQTHTRTLSLLFAAMVSVDVLINTQADTTSSYFLQAKIGVLDWTTDKHPEHE